MADLSINFKGIRSPNPFWLASGPPSNSGDQVKRAFDAGWGGAVWKTLGNPAVNLSSRYAALRFGSKRMMGLNNIELISDRGLSVNLREIAEVKKAYPNHAVVASIMVDTKEEWREIIRRVEDTGADGIELNFGCPHGMCERGMGSAVGQEPKIAEKIAKWAVDFSNIPVLVKLTPNVADITEQGMAAVRAKADGVALINTIKSIMGVDLDDLIPFPKLRNGSTNGGYCGPAIKPIALHMVATLAKHPEFNLEISGVGGIRNWRDAAEFIALGCTSVQVCAEVMFKGFNIVKNMNDRLNSYLDSKGFKSVNELRGKAIANYKDWGDLDMNYKVVSTIDPEKCTGCHNCYVACKDGAYQSISLPPENGEKKRVPIIHEDRCVGCNLCSLVCSDDAIHMREVSTTSEIETWNDRIELGKNVVTDGIFL